MSMAAWMMASTRMRSGKLRFMVPIVGDEARHGRARLARGRPRCLCTSPFLAPPKSRMQFPRVSF